MKTERIGIFESNSSSSHSISIDRGTTIYNSIIPNENGEIILSGGEFGWEVEEYNDPLTKANYCLVDNQDDEQRLEMLKEVIENHTGSTVKFVFGNWGWGEKSYGYIDHQSYGTSHDAFIDRQTLKDFIFGRRSTLYTDNDNH